MANLMAAEWDFSLPQGSGRQALLSRCCVPPAVPTAATDPGDSAQGWECLHPATPPNPAQGTGLQHQITFKTRRHLLCWFLVFSFQLHVPGNLPSGAGEILSMGTEVLAAPYTPQASL